MDNDELTRLAVKLLEKEAQRFVRQRSIIKPGPLKANKQFLSNTLRHNEISNKRINQKLERSSGKASDSDNINQKDESSVRKRKLISNVRTSHLYSKNVGNGRTSKLSPAPAPAPAPSTSISNNFKKKKMLPIIIHHEHARRNDKVVSSSLRHLTCSDDLDSDNSSNSNDTNETIKGNKNRCDSPENIRQFCISKGLYKPPKSDKKRNESRSNGKVITISDSESENQGSVICLDDSDSSSTISHSTKTKRKATKHKKAKKKLKKK